jgi:hypothetical protein
VFLTTHRQVDNSGLEGALESDDKRTVYFSLGFRLNYCVYTNVLYIVYSWMVNTLYLFNL